jgi:hypothetical protein
MANIIQLLQDPFFEKIGLTEQGESLIYVVRNKDHNYHQRLVILISSEEFAETFACADRLTIAQRIGLFLSKYANELEAGIPMTETTFYESVTWDVVDKEPAFIAFTKLLQEWREGCKQRQEMYVRNVQYQKDNIH